MAQANKPKARNSNTKTGDKKPPVYSSQKKEYVTLFSSLNKWTEKNSKALLILIFGLSTLFALFLFNARMDVGGDDSLYIMDAFNFIHKNMFPALVGPGYPLLLSIFIPFIGIKIVFFKFISVIFNFIALLFLYKAFKGRVPSFILYSVLLLTAVNSYILTFASLTYIEAFFMALQYILFYYLFKLFDFLEHNNNASLKDSWRVWLTVGLFIFFLALTRNVGIAFLGGMILYFAIRRQFKYILYLLGAFMVFEIPVTLLEKIFWHTGAIQWQTQSDTLFLKDPYNRALGRETLNGFVMRFFENSDLYISKRLYQILGLRSDSSIDTYSGLTFITVLFLLFAVYRSFKSKNWYLFAVGFYVISMSGVTFVALQTRWDQPRLIMIYVPVLLILFLYALYDICKKAPWGLQLMITLIIPVIFISEFNITLKKAKENLPILSKNLHGDIYYGFTPDWANYLKLSEWCENLPKDSLVACRKGAMSFIYANGRDFFGVYSVDSLHQSNADSTLAWLKRSHVKYILLAKLRLNPLEADGQIINTMNRLIYPIAKKYPQKLKFVHQEGESEEAQLYEVIY
jgi:hypothetical protein